MTANELILHTGWAMMTANGRGMTANEWTLHSGWARMTANARGMTANELILHTGWARQASLRDELTAGIDTMQHNEAYFNALRERLLRNRPTLQIRSTNAFKVLAEIDRDIQSGNAPVSQIAEFYRDDIHMSLELGRPMMHSLMRIALGQNMNFQPKASIDEAVADYVQQQLDEAQKLSLPQN